MIHTVLRSDFSAEPLDLVLDAHPHFAQDVAQALKKNMGAGDKKTGAGLGGIFGGSAD